MPPDSSIEESVTKSEKLQKWLDQNQYSRYGVDVHGLDLSTNMIDIAQDYRSEMEPAVKHRVQFYIEDATAIEYPESLYDVVYSRDAILHIKDKLSLFKKFMTALKPGGKVLISDYCVGDQEHSEHFKAYLKNRDYQLLTVKEYGNTLQRAGFVDVEAVDVSNILLEVLHSELEKFNAIKQEFIEEFTEEDFEWIRQGWVDKIKRAGEGEQVWGLFTATKPE